MKETTLVSSAAAATSPESAPASFNNSVREQDMVTSLAFEPHYSPKVLAERWELSGTMVHRMFENEPGVLRIGQPSRRMGRILKRRYYTLRIPHSVAERVHQRHLSAARVTTPRRTSCAGDRFGHNLKLRGRANA
jgi:hypothetical protein